MTGFPLPAMSRQYTSIRITLILNPPRMQPPTALRPATTPPRTSTPSVHLPITATAATARFPSGSNSPFFICNRPAFQYNSRPLIDFCPATPGIVPRAAMAKTPEKTDPKAKGNPVADAQSPAAGKAKSSMKAGGAMPRLQDLYAKTIRPELQKQFG